MAVRFSLSARAMLLAASIVAAPQLPAADPVIEALQKLDADEARSYGMYLDEQHQQPLKLREEAIFSWYNPTREQTQAGHVFVWTDNERPAVVATFFSCPTRETGERMVVHEFHSLSPERIFPVTPDSSAYQWTPQAGIHVAVVDGAPAVAATPTQRLLQIREIARGFSAETIDPEQQVWDLRLLTTPLIRYQPASGEVQDGALLAMVTSAGTDPELLLLIEARPAKAGSPPVWHAAALRFTDRNLVVRYHDQVMWSSVDNPALRVEAKFQYRLLEVPDHTYTCYRARVIPEQPGTGTGPAR